MDVTPDNSITGQTEMLLIKNLPDTIYIDSFQLEAFAFNNGRLAPDAEIDWNTSVNNVLVDPDSKLTFSVSGKLILTASLKNNPSIIATDSTILISGNNSSSVENNKANKIKIFPNPASDYIIIKGINNASVNIYSLTGKVLHTQSIYSDKNRISLSNFSKGIYILQLKNHAFNKTIRFVIN